MNNIRDLKDKAILLGWIAGLLGIISMIWILTQPLQAHYLLRNVNAAMIAMEDSRRVYSYVPYKGKRAGLLGYWYSMYNSADYMFVFAAFQDGILVPLGAITSNNGRVNEIIPLSAHAVQIMDNLPQTVLQMYTARIEAEARARSGGRGR